MRWNVANQALQYPGEIPIPVAMALSSLDRHTSRLVAIAVPSLTRSILTVSHRPLAARPAATRTAPGQRSADLPGKPRTYQFMDGPFSTTSTTSNLSGSSPTLAIVCHCPTDSRTKFPAERLRQFLPLEPFLVDDRGDH